MNIFVGNLSFDATEADVKKLFEGFGNVTSVAIVMRKEKKAPKSRGFSFVQMPDEQQALAAIAALNGKEFMGRVLNVEPARLSGQHLALKAPRPNGRAGTPPSAVDGRVRPSGQPGTYKGGRRTRSYMSRRGLAGMQEETNPTGIGLPRPINPTRVDPPIHLKEGSKEGPKPRQRSQDNPMRWRKRGDKPRSWQKSPGEHKPWEKVEGGARPWKKTEGEPKSWSKSSERPQKSRFKDRRKPGGYKR